jgi:hypothetical protein
VQYAPQLFGAIKMAVDKDPRNGQFEIKKTATPSTQASKSFAAAGYLGKNVGPVAVLCITPRDVPLTASVTAIPLGYL